MIISNFNVSEETIKRQELISSNKTNRSTSSQSSSVSPFAVFGFHGSHPVLIRFFSKSFQAFHIGLSLTILSSFSKS